jgi:hypothetical protein
MLANAGIKITKLIETGKWRTKDEGIEAKKAGSKGLAADIG